MEEKHHSIYVENTHTEESRVISALESQMLTDSACCVQTASSLNHCNSMFTVSSLKK